MSRILWDHIESHYRAQSNSGVIISIDDDAMIKVLKNAGNSVFDTEWWMETLTDVLEHWGLRSKRWTDPATQMPRIHYRLTNERIPTGTTGPIGGSAGSPSQNTGPLTNRINSTGPLSGRINSTGPLSGRLNGTSPLTDRINSGKLNTSNLNSGRLNTGNLNSGKLDEDDK